MYFMYAEPTGAADLQGVLDALTDPTRRGIFDRLVRQEQSVGVVAQEARISQPAASQHLKVLARAGLVVLRREGRRRWYRARAEGLEGLLRYVNEAWSASQPTRPADRPG